MKTIKDILMTREYIVYKTEKREIEVPYCPICKHELIETDKDYKPYYCKCGWWFYDEERDIYHINKQ